MSRLGSAVARMTCILAPFIFYFDGVAQEAAEASQRPTAPSAATAPLPAPARSPIDFFRELLAKNLAERREALSNRPPEVQKRILAKVREYESLNPNQREERLKKTELQFYLAPLMRAPATNRAEQLAQVPDDTRDLVRVRLEEWDRLPASSQKELLENEAAGRFFTELQNPSTRISPERRRMLQQGIQQWQQLPDAQREQILGRFEHFFELSKPEKEQALRTLSEAERKQLDRTLRSFTQLTPSQRAQCIRSFKEFAGMSLDERQQFLKNAEKWKLMSPDERQAWKNLVNEMPMFPAMGENAPKPPSPAPSLLHRPRSQVATNGN